jgi:hypothetical protein
MKWTIKRWFGDGFQTSDKFRMLKLKGKPVQSGCWPTGLPSEVLTVLSILAS